MKISVDHSTMYRYDRPVELGLHVIRLRPRDDGAQNLLCHELRITPQPALATKAMDQDGNVVTNAWFQQSAAALEIHSQFTVETSRENPFDFLLTEQSLSRIPAEYPAPARPILAVYAYEGTAGSSVAAFARSAAEAASWNTMDFLIELTHRIHGGLRSVDRPEGQPRTAAETLAAGEGACRDFAVLFCAACRSVGLASRFVSGYEVEAAREPAHADMHAWAEVYLPGGGWRGFDPSRGLAAGISHVAVAAGLEPEMAAPVSGSYWGAGHSSLESSIRMEIVD